MMAQLVDHCVVVPHHVAGAVCRLCLGYILVFYVRQNPVTDNFTE